MNERTTTDSLTDMPATELRNLLLSREISARELLDAHLRRIERTNPRVNAIVTLVADEATAAATAADNALARGEQVGHLHGLPVACKDLQETRGIRTTFGSTRYADNVPGHDALIVSRLRDAGAIMIGKTNTPEFGAGSQTYNALFGVTRNPYDLTRTAGGSSGGAAAALAARMIPLATGSDMGGSLRNPASFCNVVGLRPSAGLVPSWPSAAGWSTLGVDGPMARTVGDVVLLLGAIAGYDDRSPIARPGDGSVFRDALDDGSMLGDPSVLRGLRVGWSRHPDGIPVAAEVSGVLETEGRTLLERLGACVVDDEPDLRGADDAFRTIRAWLFAGLLGAEVTDGRTVANPDVAWNIEQGRLVTSADLMRAERHRTEVYHLLRTCFERHDVLALPTVQVVPFSADVHWPRDIDGVAQQTYLDWMRSCYLISVTGLPAISIPCGFTPGGLPVGLQLVGPPAGDLKLLRIAAAIEHAHPLWRRRPDPTDR